MTEDEKRDRRERLKPWTTDGQWLCVGDHPGHGNHHLNMRNVDHAELIARLHNEAVRLALAYDGEAPL